MSNNSNGNEIVKYVIYPAIGISRVGNSSQWYYAPELPGQVADPRVPNDLSSSTCDIQYKDAYGAVKKQAARFRIYGLNADGQVVSEINHGINAENKCIKVEWKVHLANRKGAWYEFTNPMDLNEISEKNGNTKKLALSVVHKNQGYGGVPYGLSPSRDKLVIDAGSVSISGANQRSGSMDEGAFMDRKVCLGELRTDEKGRLIVLGGSGEANSIRPNNPIHHFANNDGWYDDTSDGPVRAMITIDDEKPIEAEPAFVAVVPPNYGQGLYGTITMYDIAKDVYAKKQGQTTNDEKPSFEDDIWPIFKSLTDSQWVSEGLYMLFGKGSPSNFTDPTVYEKLVSDTDIEFKKSLLSWFRNPNSEQFEPTQIPSNYGDALRDFSGQPNENLWVTQTQYNSLVQWANGDFKPPSRNILATGFPLPAAAELDPIANQPLAIQPYLLTKAALQECLGGPFRPGIEISWPLRVDQMWKSPVAGELSPYRLNVVALEHENDPKYVSDDYGPVLSPEEAMKKNGPVDFSGPGTLTRWMGVPWQADAASCLGGLDESNYLPTPALWAPRAPQNVLSEQSYEGINSDGSGTFQKSKKFNYRQYWLRDLDNSDTLSRLNDMANEWSDLGIVSAKTFSAGTHLGELPKVAWVEQQRAETFTRWDPTYIQLQVAEGEITPEQAIAREKHQRAEFEQDIESSDNQIQPRKIYGRLER
ncbi:LodA/GoxA family CTQ-dependent oxidase [Vibrio chagasii]|uniref:LodA/GoxA family CTQ-dependent oxidase n=1 Tax=Vibrio chagasii TaxID=170679 RepID=UPI003373621F|nr:conserved hypothetical protein [Vibrio chagasii]